MSEDIKEMLDSLKDEINYWSKIDGRDYTQIGLSNIKKLEDYITNLQEENERLNNIIKKLENYLLDMGMPRDYLKELEDSDE